MQRRLRFAQRGLQTKLNQTEMTGVDLLRNDVRGIVGTKCNRASFVLLAHSHYPLVICIQDSYTIWLETLNQFGLGSRNIFYAPQILQMNRRNHQLYSDIGWRNLAEPLNL